MKKLAFFAAVVCLISCCGLNAFGQQAPYYVGPSARAFPGPTIGMSGMNQYCWATFGTNSHMCTTDEFFATARIPSGGNFYLWVQPSVTNCVYDPAPAAGTVPPALVGVAGVYCQEAGASTLVPQSIVFQNCNPGTGTSGAWTANSGTTGTSVWTIQQRGGWTLNNETDCSGTVFPPGVAPGSYYRVACCQY